MLTLHQRIPHKDPHIGHAHNRRPLRHMGLVQGQGGHGHFANPPPASIEFLDGLMMPAAVKSAAAMETTTTTAMETTTATAAMLGISRKS